MNSENLNFCVLQYQWGYGDRVTCVVSLILLGRGFVQVLDQGKPSRLNHEYAYAPYHPYE